MEPDGMTICSSSYGPQETMDRLAVTLPVLQPANADADQDSRRGHSRLKSSSQKRLRLATIKTSAGDHND